MVLNYITLRVCRKRRFIIRNEIELIKQRLRDTDDKFVDIAKDFNKSPKTIQNINNGKTHKKEGEVYPIRASALYTSNLKKRLNTPSKKAVPNPHILSPQLLDYIGFLSILGADIDCILEFKDIFSDELSTYFNRELSDSDILSVFSLRPTNPRSMYELLRAYDKPKVRLINLDYWLKTGFINSKEKETVLKMIL